MQGGFCRVKRNLVLCFSARPAKRSFIQKLLVQIIIRCLIVELALMVSPFGCILQMVHPAVGDGQCLEVHSILEAEVVDDLVVRIVCSVSLHRHRVGCQDDTVTVFRVRDGRPS